MDVNSINPVLEAFINILPQIGFQSVKKKSVFLGGSMLENNGIMINIGVLGPVKGVIIIGMTVDSARQFASRMMMGMEVPALDALAQSAISEMGNMVCANACTNFASAGLAGVDISPPTLIMGEGGCISLSVPKVIGINFDIDGILLDVFVGLY
ncbi:chemotaxis phosphatase chex [Lucifera butyrica]|uniref:Chemotaxis phosphatase chex n=1 Tax=Lucifera butyrica TaxID=1351585 RepID=A0A498RD40_9FIRM|nr:chemotaxis protein CheX [Lucifera butyrica]VBB09219.1 chemotaxis phosphatase chex [Lucifera butyrica]